MRRLLATLMVIALVLAPCAVTHANLVDTRATEVVQAPEQSASLAGEHSDPSHKHAAYHDDGGHRHLNGHDHGDDHDCLMNCQGWATAAVDSIRGLDARPIDDSSTHAFAMLASSHPAATARAAIQATSGHSPPTPSISVLRQTARLRI